MLTKKEQRENRKKRIKAKIKLGKVKLPRLIIFRSNQALYTAIIDDQKGETVVSAKSTAKSQKAAGELGIKIAKQVLSKQSIFAISIPYESPRH